MRIGPTFLQKGLSIIFSLILLCLFAGLVMLHMDIHSENGCGMTYIFTRFKLKPMDVPYPFSRHSNYKLAVYDEESRVYNKDLVIHKNEIPVLFIPGSAGSMNQVRSLASTVQTDILTRKSSAGFRFFAVDFDEQFTFFNGDVMRKQRDFVVAAIRTIRALRNGNKKMVIVGHSYGGLIAMSVANHELFKPEWIDLLILKSTPISRLPVLIDFKSNAIINNAISVWSNSSSPVQDAGVVSISGGMRDFLVPDTHTRLTNAVNYPTWAIEGVPDMGTDHLCILWCKEAVSHVSNMLIYYGENHQKSAGKDVLDMFYRNERIRKSKRYPAPTQPISHRRIGFGLDRKFDFEDSNKVKLSLRLKGSEVMMIHIGSRNCVKSATIHRAMNMTHHKESSNGNIWIALYRAHMKDEPIDIILKGEANCVFYVTTTDKMERYIWSWYEALITNTQLTSTVFMVFLLRLSILYREIRHQKAIILAIVSFVALFISSACALLEADMDFAPYLFGIFTATMWWCASSGLSTVFSFIVRRNLHETRLTDSAADFIYPFIIVHSVVNPCISSILMIALFSLRNGLDAFFTTLPLSIPLMLRLVYGDIPVYHSIFQIDTQHMAMFFSLVVFAAGKCCLTFSPGMPVQMVIVVTMSAEIMMHRIPLESASGFAVILLTGTRFINSPWSEEEESANQNTANGANIQRQVQN